MCEVGDDVASCSVGGFEPVGHVVEGSGELAELAGRVVMADAGARIAEADEMRCVGDSSERADDASTERDRDHRRHHGGGERAEEHGAAERVADVAFGRCELAARERGLHHADRRAVDNYVGGHGPSVAVRHAGRVGHAGRVRHRVVERDLVAGRVVHGDRGIGLQRDHHCGVDVDPVPTTRLSVCEREGLGDRLGGGLLAFVGETADGVLGAPQRQRRQHDDRGNGDEHERGGEPHGQRTAPGAALSGHGRCPVGSRRR